jgi:hypothetical protein
MMQHITTTSKEFWKDVSAKPVPAMITYGEDDINIGKAIYVHYQKPTREQLQHYWTHDTQDIRIKLNWGTLEDLKLLIAQHWPDMPMLGFGCSCCVDDLWEFNSCYCWAPIGLHVDGCPSSFPQGTRERRLANSQSTAGYLAGEAGKHCASKRSVAYKVGYRQGRAVRKYRRWGVWPE